MSSWEITHIIEATMDHGIKKWNWIIFNFCGLYEEDIEKTLDHIFLV